MSDYRSYNEDDKFSACVAYYYHGTYAEAARQTGIEYETIRYWARQDWWKELTEKVKVEVSATYRARAHKIIDLATSVVIDRLENGDPYIDKAGVEQRKKVILKDALLASLTWFDKHRIINDDKDKDGKEQDVKAIAKKLEDLGKDFGLQKLQEASVEAQTVPTPMNTSIKG